MHNWLQPIIAQLREEFGRHCQQESSTAWRLEVFTTEGRSQVVTLSVKTVGSGDKDLSRLVAISPIGALSSGINCEKLLRRNADLDVGAIAIEDVWTADGTRLPFVVFRATHLIVTADYPEVWELIVKTAEYADDLEKKVYGKDLY